MVPKQQPASVWYWDSQQAKDERPQYGAIYITRSPEICLLLTFVTDFLHGYGKAFHFKNLPFIIILLWYAIAILFTVMTLFGRRYFKIGMHFSFK